MSPRLFNIHIDCVVREVNKRMLGRGLNLVNTDDRDLSVNQIMFADYMALFADSGKKLYQSVEEFGSV